MRFPCPSPAALQDFIRKFTEKNCEKFLVTRDEFSIEQTEIHVQYKRSAPTFPSGPGALLNLSQGRGLFARLLHEHAALTLASPPSLHSIQTV